MSLMQGQIYSETMGLTTAINVIIPEGRAVNEMPVLYLLHGLSDNRSNWLRRTCVELYADKAGCIVVMPEVQRSFYTDMVSGLPYFTYITEELPKIVKRIFNVTDNPEKTYVAGLSMGGYGALKCGLTYPERYKGIAAFSAVADLQKTIDDEVAGISQTNEVEAIFGGKQIGEQNDIFKLAEKTAKLKTKPTIFVSCGTKDVLFPQNVALRSHLSKLNYDIKYIEWEADHSWEFWNESIRIAFDLFFPAAKEVK